MKRGKASSSDDEAEVKPLCVSNYHIVDDEDTPVSFSVLPIRWSGSENSDAVKRHVFLHGIADNGLQKIFMQVTAWRFDISNEKPDISLLSKDGIWIKLLRPRKSFQDTVRTILITIRFLHRVKKNRRLSAESVWKGLRKDKELSSYRFKASEKDLLDHAPLIGEAAKRDAVLAKSKLLLMVLEKLESQKLLHKEVKDLVQPRLTVVGIDSDRIDEANEESEEEDDLFFSVCALCDNGGNLLCCEGPCMRSFHATEEDGKEVCCDSLGFTQKKVDEIQSFYCKNCEYCLHQCFACGKLGSSDKVKGAEVIRCASATCDRFYHPHCVAKLLPQVVKHVAVELERNIADGDPFTCPLHYCCVCKELENKTDPELQFAVCRRCPKSYHRKCLPREIAFEDKDDEDIITRAWEELLPNNHILIYCLNHEIDDELGTPIRDHIKFPSEKAIVPEINPNYPTIERKKPGSKERIILKKKNADLDNSSGKSTAKGSKLTVKQSSGEVGSKKQADMKSNELLRMCVAKNKSSISERYEMPDYEESHNQPPTGEKLYVLKNEGSDQIKPDNQVNNVINKSLFAKPIRKLSTALPPLDADSEKSLLDLYKESRSSITLESIFKKHTLSSTRARPLRDFLEKTITMGKLEGSVDAVRIALRKLESGCNIQDVEAVCDPDVLKQIFKWKLVDKLHWYVQNGDTIVDFSCGANDFSTLMKKKLEETGNKCSYRNYDLLPTKNDASFERRDWMTVQQTELPTGSQLIMGFTTFGVEATLANKFIDKALEFKPKLLILLVPPGSERLDKKLSPYDLIWEDGNFLSDVSFSMPGSVDVNDRQIDQRNVRPPLLSLWSLPDWTTKHKVIAQEHGHVSIQHEVLVRESCNTDMLAADHTTVENCADNHSDHDHLKSANDQENQTCINEGQKRSQHHGNVVQEHQGRKYRMGKSGKTPQKRKHIEENNRTRVGVVSPAKRQAVKRIPEGILDHSQPNPINGRSSGDACQPKSVMTCPDVETRKGSNFAGSKSDGLCGIENPDSNRLSGHDPSCGNTGCSNAQLVSVTKISCKTNTPAKEQDDARLDESNHAKISVVGSEPRSFSKSDTLGCSVLQPGYGGGLLGFAPGPNLAYSSKHSAGWLEE